MIEALLLGIIAVVLYYILDAVRAGGAFVVSVAAILAVFVCNIVLLPLLRGAAASIQIGFPGPLFDAFANLLDPAFWLFQFEPYVLIPPADLLAVAVVVTAIVLNGRETADAATTEGPTTASGVAYAGTARRHDWSEVNRLVLAHAHTGGARFRRMVIDRARECFQAPAFEAGLDMGRLLRLCVALERRENLYRAIFLVLAIGLFVGLVSLADEADPTILIGVLVLAALLNGLRRARHHAAAYRRFGPERFDPAGDNGATPGQAPMDAPGIMPDGQNVLVYAGFTPFEFAGLPLGGWTVAIDIARPASGLAAQGEVKPFTEEELRDLLRHELISSEVEGLSVEELVVAQGADADALPAARESQGIKQPRVVLEPAEIDALTAARPDMLRRYFWISARTWGGDLTVSAFWRCSLKNRMLHVELSWFALLPIARTHRALDRMRDHWTSHVAQFLLGVLLFPVALIGGPVLLLARIPKALARMIGSDRRARAGEIKLDPRHNFGAAPSLRFQLMGDEFLHYFQKIDLQTYQKSVDRILLETLVDFLEDHGIDTADLKESQAAIFNSGVIVQGGDVTAQSLAVGEGASAKTSAPRAGRDRAAAKKGASK